MKIAIHSIEYFAQSKFENNFYNMNPIDFVSHIQFPVFLISGEKEYRVPMHETQALFDRIQAPKKSWFVKGMQHVNFHHQQTVEYEAHLTDFLKEVEHH